MKSRLTVEKAGIEFVHITSAHPIYDTRIAFREFQTLQNKLSLNSKLISTRSGLADCSLQQVPASANCECLGDGIGGRTARILLGSYRLFRRIRKLRPRLVHFHDPELIPLGICLRFLGYRVIYDVHEDVPKQIMQKTWILNSLRWPLASFVRVFEYLASKLFTRIVVATPSIGLRFPPHKTTIVQNFPLPDEFGSQHDLEYEDRPQAVAYVGAITAARGIKEMVSALELASSSRECRLELAGTFRPDHLQHEVSRMPGWKYVNYHGWSGRAGVSRLLRSVRAGLVLFQPLPNHLDAQPNKFFEYMCAGLPLIASDFPQWRRLIEREGCGLLVNPRDSEAIANAVEWLLVNPDAARQMGQRGRAAVEREYNWCVESRKLLDLYGVLLRNE